jgi:hypothetical protein
MNPQIAQVLQYAHENKVLTGKMLEEYKKFKPVYENSHPFTSTFGNPSTGFGLARDKNMFWTSELCVTVFEKDYQNTNA